ncbi:MAG: extracellular solute-binding protein [Lachnospiraceae bacterium]|nr:extracellular solute-binding protein [Lachnospiraceae bacterium]
MKGMNRVIFPVLLFGMLIIAGCGKMEKQEEKARDMQEIVIWTWDETFNVKAAEMAAAEYQKEHGDVRIIVETKEREEILADTKNMLSAKLYENLPDIIMIEDYDVQEVLSLYEDEFVDLTKQVDYSKFADYKNQLCQRNGHMYGIPFDSGTAALFYRIDILKQAGYTEEDMQDLTWDKYIEIGKNVYDKTGIPMLTLDPTDFPLVRLIMQSCGSWYVKGDGCTADIVGNKALQQSLMIYEQLLANNIGISVNGWNEFISAFQNGEVATVLSGGWIISSIKANGEQAGLWRVAPIPVVEENQNAVAASNVGGSAWYVLEHSANSRAAAEFVVEMFGENDSFTDSLISEIGIVPAVKNPTVFENYEAQDAFFGGQQVTKLLTGLADEIPTVNYGSKTYEIEDILEEEFQNVLVDGKMEQCLQRAQMKAEAVVRE